ncbi:MAG: hypothetical protein HDR74_05265 [Bacteroides sp.]|nr:hypothetical protein [Bacteroides sp.]
MANSFSLAVYVIYINKKGDKNALQVLTDFGEDGNNFLSDMDTMFLSWKPDENKGEKTIPIQKEEGQVGSAFRLSKKSDKEYHLIRNGQYIKGIIESGEYGTIEDGVNIETGETDFKKTAKHVLFKPFYFMLYVPKDSAFGFLIVERISQFGIATILNNAILNYCKTLGHYDDYTVKIAPVAIKKLVEKRMAALKYEARTVELRKVHDERLKISKISGNTISDKDVMTSIVYKINRGKISVLDFIDQIKNKRNEHDTFYVIDNDLKCDDIAVTINIAGKDKILSLQNLQSLGLSMDITDEVTPLPESGYPSFEKLDKQASILVSYIKEQYPNLNEK